MSGAVDEHDSGMSRLRTSVALIRSFHLLRMTIMLNIRSKSLLILASLASIACAQEGMPNSSNRVDGMWGFQTPIHYNILPRPATRSNEGHPNTFVAPITNIESKPIQPYAYGWFGTKKSPQWSRQFGYQKAYTQWTLR